MRFLSFKSNLRENKIHTLMIMPKMFLGVKNVSVCKTIYDLNTTIKLMTLLG